jgi:hypothetical protein
LLQRAEQCPLSEINKIGLSVFQSAYKRGLASRAVRENQNARIGIYVTAQDLPHRCPRQSEMLPVLLKIESVRAFNFVLRKQAAATLDFIRPDEINPPDVNLVFRQYQFLKRRAPGLLPFGKWIDNYSIPRRSVGGRVGCSPVEWIPTSRVHAQSSSSGSSSSLAVHAKSCGCLIPRRLKLFDSLNQIRTLKSAAPLLRQFAKPIVPPDSANWNWWECI